MITINSNNVEIHYRSFIIVVGSDIIRVYKNNLEITNKFYGQSIISNSESLVDLFKKIDEEIIKDENLHVVVCARCKHAETVSIKQIRNL